ncbi:MAG: DNA recombination protein RmuC [bacterium]
MSSVIFLIIIILLGFAGVFYFLNKKFQELKKDSVLSDFSKNMSEMMRGVAKELGSMQEIGRDMKKLQDIFQSPKLRGNIGEQILRDLLEQILPKNSFKLQHQFREGQIVDAIIKTSQGIVPIDSKFPTGDFDKRQIKFHIDSISRKYILPQEGTVDFAIMYVPSENTYYELVIKHPDLLQYSYDKKVYFVSPNNFYYFLKIIMIGLEGAKIEEASRKILAGIKAIEQESGKFSDELGVLLRHISNAKSSSERVDSRFRQLSSKIDNIQMLQGSDKQLLE